MDKYTFAKLVNLSCLIGAVVWLARAPDWEPLVTSIGFCGTLVAIEIFDQKQEKGKFDPEEEVTKFNPEIRSILTKISGLPKTNVQPSQIQDVVRGIASTIARIHFNRDDMPIPRNAPRIYVDGAKFNCDVCEAKSVDVYTTGYCPRCRLDSRTWMQTRE